MACEDVVLGSEEPGEGKNFVLNRYGHVKSMLKVSNKVKKLCY